MMAFASSRITISSTFALVHFNVMQELLKVVYVLPMQVVFRCTKDPKCANLEAQ